MAETELSPKITMIPHGTFLESHPDYCKVWPPMPPQTFRELTDTITVAALRRHPVIIYEGMILDGQHRFQAAQIRGMDCPSREYIGDDPGGYVIQENATRRHSPLNMIAQVVVGIRDLQPRGRPQTDQETRQYSSEELASEIGASPSTVERARQIEREGLGDQVRSGDLTANEAINQIRSNRQPSITRTPIQDDRSPDEFDDQESDVDADADPAGDDEQDFPDFGSTPDFRTVRGSGGQGTRRGQDRDNDARIPRSPSCPDVGRKGADATATGTDPGRCCRRGIGGRQDTDRRSGIPRCFRRGYGSPDRCQGYRDQDAQEPGKRMDV